MYEYGEIIFLLAIIIGIAYALTTDIYTVRWVHWRYVFYGLPLAVFSAGYFISPFAAMCFYGLLLFAGVVTMPLLVKKSKKSKVFGDFVLREIGFGISVCGFAIALQVITKLFVADYLSTLIITLLQFVYLLISIIYLLYYGIDGDLLSSASIVALYQTNKKEIISFIKNAYSWQQYLLIACGFICLTAVLLAANSSLLIKTPLTLADKGLLLAAMLLTVLNLRTTFKHSCLWNMINESLVYLKALKYWQTKKVNADYKAVLKDKAKTKDNVFVLVIGESQTKDHLEAYGYQRETTPWLARASQDENFLLFQNAYSSHVLTMYVLAKALTESSQYNGKSFGDSVSLIEVAKKAGFKTFFLSNHEKHSVFANPAALMADEADTLILTSAGNKAANVFDSALLPEFAKFKDEPGNKLFIIHLQGSHFEYEDRYPKEFAIFDGCRDICTEGAKRPEKLCQYDNSIRYTDYVLSEIQHIAANVYNADSVIYFSDHGDAVKRDQKHTPGMFGFDMTRIPFWMYFSDDYRERNTEKVELLQRRLTRGFTNDMIYDTLLGIMNIDTDRYNASQDFSAMEYKFRMEDLLTMNGTVSLTEELKEEPDINAQEIFA